MTDQDWVKDCSDDSSLVYFCFFIEFIGFATFFVIVVFGYIKYSGQVNIYFKEISSSTSICLDMYWPTING